jgi:ring-1,2-phenylacetyl-CoA epoxidase subunit PaaC
MSNETNNALKELMTRMADDAMIIGHRNSEWIGIGPILEEDIAFGSLAQDKTGHAYNLYLLLQESGCADPDTQAFGRTAKEYKCCHLVEYPTGEYDFSLVRHFLFDHAEYQRYEMLSGSSYEPLANVAKKYKAEIKYHIFHADTWITQLGQSTDEAKARMQSALNEAYDLAQSIFEPGTYEEVLRSEGIFDGEAALKSRWQEMIAPVVEKAGLKLPEIKDPAAHFGGRKGYHTEYLEPLLNEMTEVYRAEEGVEW